MSSTVLGKRSRSVHEPHLPTRSKRRAQSITDGSVAPSFEIVHDRNVSDDTRAACQSNRTAQTPRFEPIKLVNQPSPSLKRSTVRVDRESADQDENVPQQISTPTTTRYRDALSQKLLQTPRHRVLVPGRPITPGTPRTPSTPSTSSNSVFLTAKKAFDRGIKPVAIVGRSKERTELESFIKECLSAGKGGSIYVSGPPGTGKSALITEACMQFQSTETVQYAYVNCMSTKLATDVYRLTASALELSDDVFESDSKGILHAESCNKHRTRPLLVVLDEIDQLLSLDHEVLYSLFEWSLAKSSKLILVGISNALDLTDRFLPRLKARNIKPKLLPFLPYNSAEISTVLSTRARSLLPENAAVAVDFTPFLHPTAIQLISKKVAAQTGDLRKAFDIVQRVIELVDIETREKYAREVAAEQQQSPITPSRSPLGEIANLSSPGSRGSQSPADTVRPPKTVHGLLSQLTIETAPRATLAHVVRVTSAAFNNGAVQRLKGLNLQQKAILCALLTLEQATGPASSLPSPPTPTSKGLCFSAPRIRDVFTAYSALCRRDNVLHPLSNTEFRDVIASLETQSLITAIDGKAGSFSAQIATPSKRGRGGFGASTIDDRKIKACVGLKDVEAVVEGVGSEVLRMILHGEGLF